MTTTERTPRARLWGCLGLALSACSTSAPPVDAAPDAPPADASDAAVDRSPGLVVIADEHVPCAARNPLRNPYFGDLHVHTKLSFDAITYDVRGGPTAAYAFARGEPAELPPYAPDGTASRRLRLTRPLDFAAVTDHAEYLAETALCHDVTSAAYESATCAAYREARGLVSSFSLALGGLGARPQVCDPTDGSLCNTTADRVWQSVQDAAEAAYDRTSACRFTSFVAYEWSGSPGGTNAHRNVIFRGRTVPRAPITFFDAPTPEQLWRGLQSVCLDAAMGCDVLAIPHNGNASGGSMFNPLTERREYTREEAARRARLEPLVEVYQHKGASECLRSVGNPLASEDPRCDFEQLFLPACAPGVTAGCTPLCAPGALGALTGLCEHPSDFARGALRNGLRVWQRTGVDPFHLGFIASTDTHAAIPGATDEGAWPGHTGTADSAPADRLTPHQRGMPAVTIATSGPGGLAVLWAEENARGALFDAMRRREAYATSGTRIVVRFFGGWELPGDLCDRTDQVAAADARGVPMGSDLPARPAGAGAPVFWLSALRDLQSVGLERIQIVKGWVEGDETRERVFDVRVRSGEPGAVDLATCAPGAAGADALCDVWRDPSFDPAVPAFYYARVLEDPTCRWSRRLCNELRVDCATQASDSPLRACCDRSLPPTVQERAWTSPIWFLPQR